MQFGVLTFCFNELDSLVAAAIPNRMKTQGSAAHILSPTEDVTLINGIIVRPQRRLELTAGADDVLIGSGISARGIAAGLALLARFAGEPARAMRA